MMRRGIGRVGRPGLVGTMARTAVVAGTATAVVGGMQRHQANKAQTEAEAEAYREQQEMAAMQQAAAAAPPPPPPAASGESMDDKIAQLSKLAELKAQGILTEAEFEAQKARILGA
jgi:putative oligomerization/nucleic acid binding protein